jgi:ABC-type multidrug transport system fused ATPase/permease subunit
MSGDGRFKDRYKEMNKGLETPIYKDFDEDGVEISGGEAQKIALARALIRTHNLSFRRTDSRARSGRGV